MRRLRHLSLAFYFLLRTGSGFASHIIGGDISYECIGGNNYVVTLHVYRDCDSTGVQLDNPAYYSIFNGSGLLFLNDSVYLQSDSILQVVQSNPCENTLTDVCVEMGTYMFIVYLPPAASGYTIAYQRCCRLDSMTNISNSGSTGATFTAQIP